MRRFYVSLLNSFSLFSIFLFITPSCQVFRSYDEIDLYGIWQIEQVSVDIDVEGDNLVQVLTARAFIRLATDEMNDEMNHRIDSAGGSMTFNDDHTFYLDFLDDHSAGTWYFNEEDRSISLTADSLSMNNLNIEKLTSETLIITWLSNKTELDSDEPDEDNFSVQVTIEAVFGRE